LSYAQRSGNRCLFARDDFDAKSVTTLAKQLVRAGQHLERMLQIALEMRAQYVFAQDHDFSARVTFVTLETNGRAAFTAVLCDFTQTDRETNCFGDHPSRIRMKIRITYQNMSATDENSASDAATC